MTLENEATDSPNHADAGTGESFVLKDLESGGSGNDGFVNVGSHETTDDSFDLPEDEAEYGLLGGQRSRHTDRDVQFPRRPSQLGCCGAFLRGPDPPRKHRIEPFFKSFQTAPIHLIDRLLPNRTSRLIALVAFYALWATLFLTTLDRLVVRPEAPGYGAPNRLSCGARLWHNSTLCGADGDACRPFDTDAFAFRCPAGCLDTILLEPYTVGDQEINYKRLVIGGAPDANSAQTPSYRGDSFICAAAMHAGVISNAAGGCSILQRTGEKSNFGTVNQNGILSISFDSYFPLSYTFEKGTTVCRDPRWPLFALSVAFTAVISLCTTSPAIFYTSVWFISWFQVALVSDPPFSSDYLEVVSIGMGRLLPAAFVGWVLYHFCVRETLTGLNAQWEKTILWLGPFWVGALNTDTFDKIPISRLTPHDIQQQPGAIPALIIIVGFIVFAMVTQTWVIWTAGKLPRYLLIYGIMSSSLGIMIALPQLNLRIHHYILALLFLPGTAFQTRPCLVYQGLLVGLFINGIARWGFDSILQTPAALLGDAQLGSLLPTVATSILQPGGNNITFSIPSIPADVAGIAVLVNDVLRSHVYSPGPATDTLTFHWTRLHQDLPEYFRFGYIKTSSLGGLWYEDFTKAGVWKADGEWVEMAPGPSR
ncbi:LCCL domain protein [Talaromyces proteolyticus]|uniref:LCCL domain protein n=1 Tax=Talaromyces proteolyticus TaxID=1131652 RepID=A0AAD4L0X1_9EURO|nr:LCCL domain protein [Talaromyces proteolyticus]KAH8701835.1 LCCL domain protein [Talaromyces proteolyticus]